jgi:hypothetical protein
MNVNDGTEVCPTCLSAGSTSTIRAVADLRAKLAAAERARDDAKANERELAMKLDGIGPELFAAEKRAAELQERLDSHDAWCDAVHEAEDRGVYAKVRELEKRAAELEAQLHWEDVDDEWTEAIDAAHPTRSGSHDAYGTAMRMVGHRHSKGQLVSLVNWLLVSRGAATADAATLRARVADLKETFDDALVKLAAGNKEPR